MMHGGQTRWAHTRAPHLDPWREYDACGVGFVARASGERSPEVVRLALQALARVAHRGAAATDNSGDGAGVLTQIPERLLRGDATRTRRVDARRRVAGDRWCHRSVRETVGPGTSYLYP